MLCMYPAHRAKHVKVVLAILGCDALTLTSQSMCRVTGQRATGMRQDLPTHQHTKQICVRIIKENRSKQKLHQASLAKLTSEKPLAADPA